MRHVNFIEQGACGRCGSTDVTKTGIDGGGPGENILVFFICNDCGCEFIECYEYVTKGVFQEEEE